MRFTQDLTWWKIIGFVLILYFIALTLWLMHYDQFSIRKNLRLKNHRPNIGLFVNVENNLSLHLWPELGFSGRKLNIDYYDGTKTLATFNGKRFFIAMDVFHFFLGRMTAKKLSVEEGSLTINDLHIFKHFLEKKNPLALEALQVKNIRVSLPTIKRGFYLLDAELKIHPSSNHYETSLNLNYRNEYIHIDFKADPFTKLLMVEKDLEWSFHTRFKTMGASIEWIGRLEGPAFKKNEGRYAPQWAACNIECVFVGGDLSAYNALFTSAHLPKLGPYQLTFDLAGTNEGGSYHFKDINLQIANQSFKGYFDWQRSPRSSFALNLSSASNTAPETLFLQADLFQDFLKDLRDLLESAIKS